ncbi:hypothetical protein CHCC15337_1246 [Bacillus paralicheniformis]|uniref:Uncharacterized protein n=1 Tax=Bacillus paralicheniformis TaxID=1648923 RepID=A0A6N2GR04_9BACI|nr:hypothetical protein B4121_0934 [Bacillus paralicheniformis]TWJ65951.1 hypothetical protein CHCC5021_0227 [Bacillus paralicheniformis]TWK22948.1 hypothetical protein CHCC20372_3355 [Bacillus paralicheniformis]TWL03599.1 hypothetical protein CHCC19468_0457 [Bacillus paralicheniformis]TWL17608.1 hypothetical protein CHCC19467_3002 [Bacillus paralicheniformis]
MSQPVHIDFQPIISLKDFKKHLLPRAGSKPLVLSSLYIK